MNLEFHQISLQDEKNINEVYNILRACGEDMYKNEGLLHWKNPYSIENIERDVSSKLVYVVKSNEISVATFMLSFEKSMFFDDDTPAVYLSKFATLPRYSGKGIGAECISFIEELAKEKVDFIRLDVYCESKKAINFYSNRGFEITDEKPTRNFRVFCMEKKIR